MRSGSLMLMPIEAQKIEGIGQSPLEEDVRDRENQPGRSTERPLSPVLDAFLK